MKLSNALKQEIAKTEFWLVAAADVAITAVSLLHGGLSPQHAVQYGTELNGLYVVASAVPKGIAALNGVLGVAAPDPKADALGKKISADVAVAAPIVEDAVRAVAASPVPVVAVAPVAPVAPAQPVSAAPVASEQAPAAAPVAPPAA